MSRLYIGIAASLMMSGCSAAVDNLAQPAVMTSPTTASLTELESAITGLLDIESVKISEQAFSDSSMLTLERNAHQDSTGQLIMGRNLEMPISVQLMIQQGKCIVVADNKARSGPLEHVTCKAL